MKNLLLTTSLLSLMAASVVPAFAANSRVESLLAAQEDLSKFRQALLNTGVLKELNENTEYTLFAPTNAAFAEIQPRVYPCFYSYSTTCRNEVAAVMRNHIVPHNVSMQDMLAQSGGISTMGVRSINVEEPTKGEYTAEGHRVLFQIKGDKVSLYPIDGVIISNEELAQFHTAPLSTIPASVNQK